MLPSLAVIVILITRFISCLLRRPYAGARRHDQPLNRRAHHRPKPPWVRNEIIRLKALMREAGTCRTIAAVFNRRFAAKRKMTVGKTFVSALIRTHRYEIDIVRRKLKNARPRRLPRNAVWGIDLTGKTDAAGLTHHVLGILDHGSRASIALAAPVNKRTFTLLGHLFVAIGAFGKPRAVRTDNEAVFTSRLFRLALFFAGIRHQCTDPGCPWQNGRVERFFGTLKNKLDRLAVDSIGALNLALGEFRFFYNHVRVHQNLDGRTPAEAWAKIDPFTNRIKTEYWFEAWEGLLRGYYLRR